MRNFKLKLLVTVILLWTPLSANDEIKIYQCRFNPCDVLIKALDFVKLQGRYAKSGNGRIIFLNPGAEWSRAKALLEQFDQPPKSVSGKLRISQVGTSRDSGITAIAKSSVRSNEEVFFTTLAGRPYRMNVSQAVITRIGDVIFSSDKGLFLEMVIEPFQNSAEVQLNLRSELSNQKEFVLGNTQRVPLNTWSPLSFVVDGSTTSSKSIDLEKIHRQKIRQSFDIGVQIYISEIR